MPDPVTPADLLERFRRVLLQEQRLGYRDRGALGGLDRFIAAWAADLRQRAPHLDRRLEELKPRGVSYRAFDGPARAAWVSEALAWLDQATPLLDQAPADRVPSPSGRGQGEGEPSRPSSDSPRTASSVPAKTAAASRRAQAGPEQSRSNVVESAHPEPVEGRATSPVRAPASPLDTPLSHLIGVGPATSNRLKRLALLTVRDLLRNYPRRYDDFTALRHVADLRIGEDQTCVATVWSAGERQLGRRLRGTEAIVGDETGNIRVVWFNQPHVARSLQPNSQVVLSGRVTLFRGQRVFENPTFEPWRAELLHTARLVPIYALTEGLYAKTVRELAKRVVDRWAGAVPEVVPESARAEQSLLPVAEALKQIHFPDNADRLAEAQRRLAFEEFLLLQVGVLRQRQEWQAALGMALLAPAVVDEFIASLPFVLTGAQRRALDEVLGDLARAVPMSRLLQGDVGSGKTVVATTALLVAVACGAQGVLMAPTEVLAEQHYRTLSDLLGRGGREVGPGLFTIPAHPEAVEGSQGEREAAARPPLRLRLLLGGMTARQKAQVRAEASRGEADIIIGTHALIQESIDFPRLGLSVVDEQHRFGVMQRLSLRHKGFNPHMLVMTATPIPRTLALTLYGDLDVSTIDEMPPGRQPIRTRWIGPEHREVAEAFLRQQLEAGRQAFVICPLIEESEAIEATAATQEWERLRTDVYPDFAERIGLLHGRMSTKDKESVMRRFRDGELAILVATPVVEVGIDVPNATVMLVEAADRFGLAQLHQLRGRVGRGKHQSYCLLVAEDPSPEAQERLKLLERISDGFALAEEDLRLRGPGEFFGTRQSGLPELRLARLTDTTLLAAARQAAQAVLATDPSLSQPEHATLRAEIERTWHEPVTEFS